MSKCGSMDGRCPRQLKDLPDSWCNLAVLRLKAIRNAGRELTEEEEANLPGCPWAVQHQMANYCFFNYVQSFTGDKAPSDLEIASLIGVSIDTVRKTEKVALNKMRNVEEFKDLKEMHGDESVISGNQGEPDYHITR